MAGIQNLAKRAHFADSTKESDLATNVTISASYQHNNKKQKSYALHNLFLRIDVKGA